MAAVGTLLISGWRYALGFSAITGALIAGGVLVGQHVTDGWFWVYIYKLHQGHSTDWAKVWKLTPLELLYHSALLWFVGVCWAAVGVAARRVSKTLVFWMLAALCGLATSAVSSATQGAYDNAYIPGVFFVVAFAAAAAVELPALAAGRPEGPGCGPHRRLWGSARPVVRPQFSRVLGLMLLSLLSAHILVHWFRTLPHRPTARLRAQAGRLISELRSLGPDVFVPYHPYYNVLAGGKGHMHIMGVNDAADWAKKITGDPARDRRIKADFRRSIFETFRQNRWSAVVFDRTYTHQLPGLRIRYRLRRDLLRWDASPPVLTGNPCRPRYVWLPARRRDLK